MLYTVQISQVKNLPSKTHVIDNFLPAHSWSLVMS